MVIVSHEPERHFIFRLIEHSKWISSWIKSADREFYSLEYEYWKGEKDRVRRPFSPDFLLEIFEYTGCSHAAADAHGNHPVFRASFLHFVNQLDG